MTRRFVAQEALRILAIHAKMHRHLDTLSPYDATMQRIEEREILAYADDAQFSELERLKKELLDIRFIESR